MSRLLVGQIAELLDDAEDFSVSASITTVPTRHVDGLLVVFEAGDDYEPLVIDMEDFPPG